MGLKFKAGYTLSENWYIVGYTFPKIWCKQRVYFLGASMVGPRPKSGYVHSPSKEDFKLIEKIGTTPKLE